MTQLEQAPVAMAAAEAAWYERDGIDPREAWQAGWAAALQWAAQHEHQWTRCPGCPHPDQPCACAGVPCCDLERLEVGLLRQEGGEMGEHEFGYSTILCDADKHDLCREPACFCRCHRQEGGGT